jgi:hypothetical protein
MNPKQRFTGRILAMVACLLLFVYAAYLYFTPYSEVAVKAHGLPADSIFACLVADTADGPKVMLWSMKYLGPFTMHPDRCTVSTYFARDSIDEAKVRWVQTNRVGVLSQARGGNWSIAWFDAVKSNVRGKSLLFGGGFWEGDVRDSNERQGLSPEQLRSLGMDYQLKTEAVD